MACTSASVSYREALKPSELVNALLTGNVPPGRRPHLRVILEEMPVPMLKGLVQEVGRWARPGRVIESLRAIAEALGASREIKKWLKTA